MITNFIIAYKSKLLFYLADENSSRLNCGMIQGISLFMNNFSTETVEIVRGTKTTFHILSPEPQLLLILKVENSSTTATDEHMKAYLLRSWNWYFFLHGALQTSKRKLHFFTRYLSYAGNQLSLFTTLPSKLSYLISSDFFYASSNYRLHKTC